VNKNVSTVAVIRAKPGTELANYQTAVSVTSLGLRTAGVQSDSSGLEFMNAHKQCTSPLKRDEQSPRYRSSEVISST